MNIQQNGLTDKITEIHIGDTSVILDKTNVAQAVDYVIAMDYGILAGTQGIWSHYFSGKSVFTPMDRIDKFTLVDVYVPV
jgi:hypothetical protein